MASDVDGRGRRDAVAENRVYTGLSHFFIFPKDVYRFPTMSLASVYLRLVQDLHFDYKTHITTAKAKKKAMSC